MTERRTTTARQPAGSGERRPRRSPAPEHRRRDPERTRERILAAALVEFGDKGFGGARVSRIAAQAGVNQQLISYYFGGKAGLYKALSARWEAVGGQLAQPGLPLDVVVVNFLRASLENRSWTRLLAWEGLTDASTERDPFLQEMVADLRRRQQAGELAPDLAPDCVLLALFAAASAPVLLPQIARRISADDPASDAFATRYAEQLTRLARHLRGGDD
jgi:TetR/AcrR family transcriptional regulator